MPTCKRRACLHALRSALHALSLSLHAMCLPLHAALLLKACLCRHSTACSPSAVSSQGGSNCLTLVHSAAQVLFTRNCAYSAATFFQDQWEGCECQSSAGPVLQPAHKPCSLHAFLQLLCRVLAVSAATACTCQGMLMRCLLSFSS